MSAFSNAIRTPFGIILPLSEVKARAIVDALNKCGGNYRLAARLLGIGKSTIYRIARTYNYQAPRVQAEPLMSISQCKSSLDLRERTLNP
jgi:DNA-binding NtrC family response regulator